MTERSLEEFREIAAARFPYFFDARCGISSEEEDRFVRELIGRLGADAMPSSHYPSHDREGAWTVVPHGMRARWRYRFASEQDALFFALLGS